MNNNEASLQLMIDHFNGNRAHIQKVQTNLNNFAHQLIQRSIIHDESKYLEPEASSFAQVTHKIKDLEYESKEYKDCKEQISSAIAHHYSENDHHPEQSPDGVAGMNLLSLVEMFADWNAAQKRHNTGSFGESIEKSIEKFGICPQLASILRNSVYLFREI